MRHMIGMKKWIRYRSVLQSLSRNRTRKVVLFRTEQDRAGKRANKTEESNILPDSILAARTPRPAGDPPSLPPKKVVRNPQSKSISGAMMAYFFCEKDLSLNSFDFISDDNSFSNAYDN